MKLIDADKLIEELIDESIYEWVDESGKIDISYVRALIYKQPIAFDVDKVIQKLELLIMDEECKLIGSSKHAFKETLKKRECYKKAIEVVKAGGIDE